MIYHGVRQTAPAAFTDWDSRCLICTPGALPKTRQRVDLWPGRTYEQRGDVDNVVFPCGYTIAPDGDTLHLYYGAADTSIALATGSVRAILGVA